jgi:tripartite-type tricarboxylate transporter receptor subunit TctC
MREMGMLRVPYRGGAPATPAMLAGEARVKVPEAAFERQHARGGAIRPPAVTRLARHTLFPEIPTIEEAGVPGFESARYRAVQAPAGVPPAVLARITEAVLRWNRQAAMRAMPAQAACLRHKAEDSATWGGVIREKGLRISRLASWVKVSWTPTMIGGRLEAGFCGCQRTPE